MAAMLPRCLLLAALTLLFLAAPTSAARGYSTRYWDCCKVHCAWSANVRDVARGHSGASFALHMAVVALHYRCGRRGSKRMPPIREATSDTHSLSHPTHPPFASDSRSHV